METKPTSLQTLRLNKFLARAGAASSRRKADELIASGEVSVNGSPIGPDQQGMQIDPSTDEVMVRGKRVSVQMDEAPVLLSLHKPVGVTVTREDVHAERVVYDLLPEKWRTTVHSIGRLDRDTSGLLLFTNDGDLTHRLTHPSFEHEKEYVVTVRGMLSREQLRSLERGVDLEDGVTAPARVVEVSPHQTTTSFRLVIHEGKNRQVRRMVKAVGLSLLDLHRVRVASVQLGNLAVGKVRVENYPQVVPSLSTEVR